MNSTFLQPRVTVRRRTSNAPRPRGTPFVNICCNAAGHGDAAPPASQVPPRRQRELRDQAVPLSAPVEPIPPAPPRRRSGNPLGFAVRAIGVVFSTAFRAADWVIGLLLPGSAYRAWRGAIRIPCWAYAIMIVMSKWCVLRTVGVRRTFIASKTVAV